MRRPNGTSWEGYQVSYYDEYGIRRTRTFSDSTSARGFDRLFGASGERDLSGVRERRRQVASVIQRYLLAIKNGHHHMVGRVRPSTKRAYEKHLRSFVQAFGNRPINSITWMDLTAYKGELLGATHSRQNAAAAFATLNRCFRFANKAGYLNQNPFDSVFGIKVDRHAGMPVVRDSFYGKEELASLLAWLQDRADRNASFPSRRDHAFVSSLCFAGLRIGETLALERGDVDFDEMLLRVRRTVVAGRAIMPVASQRLRRDVPISPRLQEIMQPYVLSHQNKLLFCKVDGSLLSPASVHSIWKAAITGTGLPYYPLRSLRHYYASRLIDSGYSAFDLMHLLGFEDYNHVMAAYRLLFFSKFDAINAMARVDFP